MRHLLTIVMVSVIAFIVYASVDWSGIELSLAVPSVADKTSGNLSSQRSATEYQKEGMDEDEEEDLELWIDTVMYAEGHSFGYRGDISMWGGWYMDTLFLGDNRILTYDSVGPSTLKLSLITRELTVDLGDPEAPSKITDFMKPMAGFRRHSKIYEQCLDSVMDETYGVIKYMGKVTFTMDHADSCVENSDKINRFACRLADSSETEKAQMPELSAFYAGYNPTKYYRPVYTGNEQDIGDLSDFIAHRTFENWIRGGDFGIGSSESVLAVSPHIANARYVTFSKYEYDRTGIGHGMYTETFHTFDLKNEKKLTNKDIFKSQSLDKVKMRLFEVMAKDPHYLAWNGGALSPGEIEGRIEAWQAPSPALKGTEWEEPERDFKFMLPDGALTESGVLFSFQPYEIDCWAAGTFHFIVPYRKLTAYMTPEAKRLISQAASTGPA